MASLPDPVWTVIIAMSAIAVVLILARLLFGKGLRRLRGLGFEIDLSEGSQPSQREIPPIAPPKPTLPKPSLPKPLSDPTASATPSPLITELPSASTEAKFMSDDYETELAARLQYDASPKDYLYVEDHTMDRQGDC
jgi:hypothetical protein